MAEPKIDQVATAEPQIDQVATAEPQIDQVATAEPQIDQVATAEPQIDQVATAEPQINISNLADIPMEDAVREKLKDSKSVNILITGKYQVGKSTLINSLFYVKGEKYVRCAVEGSLKPTTTKVSSYALESNGVVYNIYDTRGLKDGQGHDMKYIRQMIEECGSSFAFHLVIYCTKLDEPIRPDDKDALKNITLTFGIKFWKNVVIALTFANQVEPVDPDDDEEEFFKKTLETKTELLYKCFMEEKGLRIGETIANELKKRILPTGSAKKLQLPDGIEDWRAPFWLGCLAACKEEAKGAVLKVAWTNPLFVATVVGTSVATTSGTLAVVGGSGAVGAGIGLCATGFLLPLGIGLIVGGVIGGALGVGGAAGGGAGLWLTIKEKFKKKKDSDSEKKI